MAYQLPSSYPLLQHPHWHTAACIKEIKRFSVIRSLWCQIHLQERNNESLQTCVTGFSIFIFSGNCAFVTRKVDIRLWWSSSTSLLISGYMIGSPTSDRAQCLGESPSVNRSSVTPAGTEFFSQCNACDSTTNQTPTSVRKLHAQQNNSRKNKKI